MFAERPSLSLFIYLAVTNSHRQTETAVSVVLFTTDADLQHRP